VLIQALVVFAQVGLPEAWVLVERGGIVGFSLLFIVALLRGWLVSPKRLEEFKLAAQERLAAETARAVAAEAREQWWRELALQQGRVIPRAVGVASEATALAKEQF